MPKTTYNPSNMVTSLCTPRRNFVKVWCSRLKAFKGMPVWGDTGVCVKRELVHWLVTKGWHTFKTITACSDTDYPFHRGILHFLSCYKTALIISLQLNSSKEKTWTMRDSMLTVTSQLRQCDLLCNTTDFDIKDEMETNFYNI